MYSEDISGIELNILQKLKEMGIILTEEQEDELLSYMDDIFNPYDDGYRNYN